MSPWNELAEGVFRRRYDFLDLNVGLIVGENGAAVVDTRGSHREAMTLIDEIGLVTDKPVRWVINTHWHWDHTFGNHMFPEASLYGHVECKRMLEQHGDRARHHLTTRIGSDRREELEEVVIRPPEIAFANAIELDLGGRAVTAAYQGRGHTRSDVMVSVSDADVVFAGDLLEESAPPSMSEGYPLAWPETLAAFRPSLNGVAVPGHGEVMKPEAIDTQREELRAVAVLARQSHLAGVAHTDIDVSDGPYPETTMREAMRQAYRELDRTGGGTS